jgi:hypothetical protein
MAISGDPKEKAESEITEENWRFPVGYDLRPDQMRQAMPWTSRWKR